MDRERCPRLDSQCTGERGVRTWVEDDPEVSQGAAWCVTVKPSPSRDGGTTPTFPSPHAGAINQANLDCANQKRVVCEDFEVSEPRVYHVTGGYPYLGLSTQTFLSRLDSTCRLTPNVVSTELTCSNMSMTILQKSHPYHPSLVLSSTYPHRQACQDTSRYPWRRKGG